MGYSSSYQFESRIVKSEAAVLLLEFWSSRAFKVHRHEYNEIVLRVNGYGSLGKWLDDQLSGHGEIPWEQIPVQLTVRFLPKPQSTEYTLRFDLPDRYSVEPKQKPRHFWQLKPADPEVPTHVRFRQAVTRWGLEFQQYIDSWHNR